MIKDCSFVLPFMFYWFHLESFVNPPVPGADDASEVVPFTASFPYEEEESPPPPPGVCYVVQCDLDWANLPKLGSLFAFINEPLLNRTL